MLLVHTPKKYLHSMYFLVIFKLRKGYNIMFGPVIEVVPNVTQVLRVTLFSFILTYLHLAL